MYLRIYSDKKKVEGFERIIANPILNLIDVFKLLNYLNDNKILIYFFTKEDLDSFVQRSKDYLKQK